MGFNRMSVWVIAVVLAAGCYKANANRKLANLTNCPQESMTATEVTPTGDPVPPGALGRSGKFAVSCKNPQGDFDCSYNNAGSYNCIKREQNAETFDDKLHEPYAMEGTASIKGQAFLKTRGGDVKYGAGEDVLLLPKTAYFEEYLKSMLLGFKRGMSDEARKYVRTKTTNGQGEFAFEKLPAGEYIAIAQVYWEVPSTSGGMQKTGGVVVGTAKILDGEAGEIVMKSAN